MNKFLSALFLLAGILFALPTVHAQSAPETPKKTVKKKTVKKKKAPRRKKSTKKQVQAVRDMEDEKVDVSGQASINYSCEFGNMVTIHRKSNDDKQITVRWHNRLHNLVRVGTTTGADRFEGPRSGLVWIGIPAKGMLLDGNRGQPLANECKDAVQLKHST